MFSTSFVAPLIAIACVITLVVIACFYFAAKRKYKQKVDAIALQTKRLSGVLDELFRPDRRASEADIDRFLADNQDAINAAKELCDTKSIFKDMLRSSCIEEFVESVDRNNLMARLTGSNHIHDAITQLTDLCNTPMQEFEALLPDVPSER